MRYHPAIVAQAFATLGCLAPGRIFLGVGTGEAMNETPITGGEFPGRKERRLKMAEAIKVIKLLWSEERVDFEGDYYTLRRATIYDRPDDAGADLRRRVRPAGGEARRPRRRRLHLHLAARTRSSTSTCSTTSREGAEKAGRDYESIKRMIEIKVSYDRDLEVAHEGLRTGGRRWR